MVVAFKLADETLRHMLDSALLVGDSEVERHKAPH